MFRRPDVLAGVGAGALVLLSALVSPIARRANSAASETAASAVRATIARNADSLAASLVALGVALRTAASDEQRVRFAFRRARVWYKRNEGAAEFYAPALAAAFNSRRQEVDDDDAPPPSTLAPTGFPALETLLWPHLDPSNADSARRVADSMRSLVQRLRSLAPALVPTPAQLIEIGRLELARVSTLGIAGFDTPRSGDAMREGAEAIDGIRSLVAAAGPGLWEPYVEERRALDVTLGRARDYLGAHPDFESFNRLAFLAEYAEPAARAFDALRRVAEVTPVRIPRAWRVDAPSVFAAGAFDARAYAPSTAPASSPELVALGERLFAEPMLSGDRTRSCASCHRPDRAFADGMTIAPSIDPRGSRVARNTPTLINAALQPAQFADERSVTLEDQVLEVLRSPAEMHSSAERAAASLSADSTYRISFARVFGGAGSVAVTPLRVRQALAAYVRTLVSLDARFDHALRGDTLAVTAEERRGFTLFMGKAMCGTCHFAPLFSGNTPPLYMGSDVEVIGTPVTPSAPATLDPDSGRARIDHLPNHLRAFKTPSLRNVALTAPYMHNGAFRTLDEVMLFYEHGGARGAGARIDDQTLNADSLHLRADERHAIIAFLGSLTDTSRLGATPLAVRSRAMPPPASGSTRPH